MSHAWYIYMKYVRSVWFSQAINRIMNTDCMQKKIVNVTQNETIVLSIDCELNVKKS